MTLTGRTAQQHPDVDKLAPTTQPLVIHYVRQVDKTGRWGRLSTNPVQRLGSVDPETGTYTSDTRRMTESERRAAGLRRNGRPRQPQQT